MEIRNRKKFTIVLGLWGARGASQENRKSRGRGGGVLGVGEGVERSGGVRVGKERGIGGG